MGKGLESGRVRGAFSRFFPFHWDRLPECAASEPEFLLEFLGIGDDGNW